MLNTLDGVVKYRLGGGGEDFLLLYLMLISSNLIGQLAE